MAGLQITSQGCNGTEGMNNRFPQLVEWEVGNKGPAGVICGKRQKPAHRCPAVSTCTPPQILWPTQGEPPDQEPGLRVV